MRRRSFKLAAACILAAGCSVLGWLRPEPSAPPADPIPAAPAPSPPVRSVEAPTPAPPVEAASKPPKAPSARIEPADNGDRVKRITAARGDLKTGLTQLELRAMSACSEPGAACVENQGLIERARALDKSLATALVDPKAPVDWAEVTTVLRAVVDTAMKGAK